MRAKGQGAYPGKGTMGATSSWEFCAMPKSVLLSVSPSSASTPGQRRSAASCCLHDLDSSLASIAVPLEAMTIQEFGRRYSLCHASVYVEIREGRLTACKIGGKTVILREDAERWVANLPRIKPASRTLAAGEA